MTCVLYAKNLHPVLYCLYLTQKYLSSTSYLPHYIWGWGHSHKVLVPAVLVNFIDQLDLITRLRY